MDSGNYIFWKAQVLTTIRAFDLFPLLNKVSPPPKYVAEPGDKEAVGPMLNPEYMTWLRSDQLLLGWLFSTIDKDILTQVIHCESSSEIWSTLKNLYSRQTIVRSFQFKQQLRLVKKDDMSINDYILKIKTIGHSLAAIGEPLDDKELLLAILNDLDHDYENVVSLVTYKMNDVDLDKVHYLLLMHE